MAIVILTDLIEKSHAMEKWPRKEEESGLLIPFCIIIIIRPSSTSDDMLHKTMTMAMILGQYKTSSSEGHYTSDSHKGATSTAAAER